MSYYPGQYGQPPPFGGYGQPGAPPGMGPPPGMGAPPGMQPPGMGMPPAPGMQQAQQQNRSAYNQNFQPPPNINFNAPVIRLGTAGPPKQDGPFGGGSDRRGQFGDPVGNRRGAGLGYDRGDQQRNRDREPNILIPPMSREEVARTIFVGNITDSFGGEDGLKQILNCPGGLRRWTRAIDSNGKPTTFGFAEYEDADSLATAIEVLKDVQIKSKDQPANSRIAAKVKSEDAGDDEAGDTQSKVKKEPNGNVESSSGSDEAAQDGQRSNDGDEDGYDGADGTTTSLKMDRLLVVIDAKSQAYVDEWRSRGSLKSPEEAQFRIDAAREELEQVVMGITNPPEQDHDGDALMSDNNAGRVQTETRLDENTGEIVTIPLTVEDELSDIPENQREKIKLAIASFRDRSNRRDKERLRHEEEISAQEKARNSSTMSSGFGGNANKIPLGPRASLASNNSQPPGTPTGPRGMTGVQIPRDYQQGVNFVTGNADGVPRIKDEDEDTDASDEELERRRTSKRNAEEEKRFLDLERNQINFERNQASARTRQEKKELHDAEYRASEKAKQKQRLHDYDDEYEATKRGPRDLYYEDYSAWLRRREAFLRKERAEDDHDRGLEESQRQLQEAQQKKAQQSGDVLPDRYTANVAKDQGSTEPLRFKMSLGNVASAKKNEQPVSDQKGSQMVIENLLEAEEDDTEKPRAKQLVPISEETAASSNMSKEEYQAVMKEIANHTPKDREGLWRYSINWEYVNGTVMSKLRQYAERRVLDSLSIQDDDLVQLVMDLVADRKKPQDLMKQLEPFFGDYKSTLDFVIAFWKMLIYRSEAEKRGLEQ